MFFFRPNDTHDLHQTPPANMTMPGVERIKGYRFPAPGWVFQQQQNKNKNAFFKKDILSLFLFHAYCRSQPHKTIPTLYNEDDKYDIKYYSRDTRRKGDLDEKVLFNQPLFHYFLVVVA